MLFMLESLVLHKVLKPKENARFLISYSVHCCAFCGTGPGSMEMASLNTSQRKKIIGFRAYDYVIYRENSCPFLGSA